MICLILAWIASLFLILSTDFYLCAIDRDIDGIGKCGWYRYIQMLPHHPLCDMPNITHTKCNPPHDLAHIDTMFCPLLPYRYYVLHFAAIEILSSPLCSLGSSCLDSGPQMKSPISFFKTLTSSFTEETHQGITKWVRQNLEAPSPPAASPWLFLFWPASPLKAAHGDPCWSRV